MHVYLGSQFQFKSSDNTAVGRTCPNPSSRVNTCIEVWILLLIGTLSKCRLQDLPLTFCRVKNSNQCFMLLEWQTVYNLALRHWKSVKNTVKEISLTLSRSRDIIYQWMLHGHPAQAFDLRGIRKAWSRIAHDSKKHIDWPDQVHHSMHRI